MTKDLNECINCGLQSSGNFCSNCGQKLLSHTITWKFLLSDFMDRWIGMDTKYARTIVALFKAPDIAINTYIKGNSVKHIGPLGYYIVMTAVMLLLFEVLGIPLKEFMAATNDSLGLQPQETSDAQAQFQQEIQTWISDNFRIFSGLIIPFIALAAKIYYRKTSYLHHLIRFTYIQAHTIWVTLLMIILFAITGNLYSIPMMVLSTSYLCWALMRCYPQKWKVWGFVKGLLVWFTGYMIFLISAGIIGVAVGIWMAYFSKI